MLVFTFNKKNKIYVFQFSLIEFRKVSVISTHCIMSVCYDMLISMKFSILLLFDKSWWKELLATVNLTLAASSEWDQHTLYVKRSTHKKTLKIRDASETAHTVCCKHPSIFIHKKKSTIGCQKNVQYPNFNTHKKVFQIKSQTIYYQNGYGHWVWINSGK